MESQHDYAKLVEVDLVKREFESHVSTSWSRIRKRLILDWRYYPVFRLLFFGVTIVGCFFVLHASQFTCSTYLRKVLLKTGSTINYLNHQPTEGSQPTRDPFSSLKGPLIKDNFPDPCVLYHDRVTYAFATNNRKAGAGHIHVQVASTTDNNTWAIIAGVDALPETAPWETGQAVWAPDVKHLPDGRFLLYYTDSLKSDPATHCIGAALSDEITGPYHPLLKPLICPHGGAIDPAGFLDRSTGKRYIVYKVDGNSLGHGGSCNNGVLPIESTPLVLQEVHPSDGITLIGRPIQIHDRHLKDGPLIEAPTMYLSSEGIYFLFFSANCFTTPFYHTTYATAMNVTGPYVRASRPLFMTGDSINIQGPGGMDIIHHAYTDTESDSIAEKNMTNTDSEGRLILFHGILGFHNDAEIESLTSVDNWRLQKPVKDLYLPFVRGMYSGTAFFKGKLVSLSDNGFKDDENQA